MQNIIENFSSLKYEKWNHLFAMLSPLRVDDPDRWTMDFGKVAAFGLSAGEKEHHSGFIQQ